MVPLLVGVDATGQDTSVVVYGDDGICVIVVVYGDDGICRIVAHSLVAKRAYTHHHSIV